MIVSNSDEHLVSSFLRDVPFMMEWKRPHELTEEPKLFDEGSSRFDINQGELGDCWLLAALANLTMNKKLLYQVWKQGSSITSLKHMQLTDF